MSTQRPKTEGWAFDSKEVMMAAIRLEVRRARYRHKLLGNPVAEWRDGKVVWVQPEDIDVGDESELRDLGGAVF